MKNKILFSRKNKKKIFQKCRLLKFLPSMKSVNEWFSEPRHFLSSQLSNNYPTKNHILRIGWLLANWIKPSKNFLNHFSPTDQTRYLYKQYRSRWNEMACNQDSSSVHYLQFFSWFLTDTPIDKNGWMCILGAHCDILYCSLCHTQRGMLIVLTSKDE